MRKLFVSNIYKHNIWTDQLIIIIIIIFNIIMYIKNDYVKI